MLRLFFFCNQTQGIGVISKIRRISNQANVINDHRKIFDEIFSFLNLKTWEDWYKAKHYDIIIQGGYKILPAYDYDWTKALCTLYPENTWKMSKFKRRVNEYWKNRSNQQIFLSKFASEKRLCDVEDFYALNQKDLLEFGGKTLLHYFGNSHIALFLFNYPDLPWQIWKFKVLPSNYWKSIIQQRNFFLELGKSLNFRKPTDFYDIKYKDIIEYGGSGLLALYGYSHINAFMNVFPNIDWKPWEFLQVPKGYWDIPENVKRCMDGVAVDLLIKEPHQWTRISTHQLKEKGLHSLVAKFGNIQNILEFCYPEYNWQQHHKEFWLVNNTAKIQQQLFTFVKEALPNEKIENRINKQEAE